MRTKLKLEQVSDIDIYFFIEKGLREGISYIAKRHSKANNKDMKNYHPTKPSKCVMCLLYGGFKCLKNIDNFDVNSVSENSSIGYILEVDLEYPNYTNCIIIIH